MSPLSKRGSGRGPYRIVDRTLLFQAPGGYSIKAAMLARKGLKELTLGRDLRVRGRSGKEVRRSTSS